MKTQFFIIRKQEKIRSRKNLEAAKLTMYFTGTAKNGTALFSTHKAAALPFMNRDTATSVRLAIAPQDSQLEQLETINFVPPPEDKKDASGFTKFKH